MRKLGKRQLFMLDYMNDKRRNKSVLYPGCGTSMDAATCRLLDSLVKHGLVEKKIVERPVGTGRGIELRRTPVWALTDAGRKYDTRNNCPSE